MDVPNCTAHFLKYASNVTKIILGIHVLNQKRRRCCTKNKTKTALFIKRIATSNAAIAHNKPQTQNHRPNTTKPSTNSLASCACSRERTCASILRAWLQYYHHIECSYHLLANQLELTIRPHQLLPGEGTAGEYMFVHIYIDLPSHHSPIVMHICGVINTKSLKFDLTKRSTYWDRNRSLLEG